MTPAIRVLGLVLASTFGAFVFFSVPSNAQNPATDTALAQAAQKAFKAIADGDADTLKPLVEPRYAKKLNPDLLRPSQAGPKVTVTYDGNVRVMRAEANTAVVEASVFAPASKDIPKGEADKLTLYMQKEKGQWLVAAPDKKQAVDDATMNGGWFHRGAFTFCPNKGIEYLGSHFSNKLNCQATAVCR